MTLLSSPLLTLKVLAILLGRGFKATLNFILNNSLLILGLISLVAAFLYAPGPHELVTTHHSWLRNCIVSVIGVRLYILRFVVDRAGDHVECRVRHRSPHFRLILGTTHCQGNHGRKPVQLCAREPPISMGLSPLQSLSRVHRHPNCASSEHLFRSHHRGFPLGSRHRYWRTSSLLCRESRYDKLKVFISYSVFGRKKIRGVGRDDRWEECKQEGLVGATYHRKT